MFKIIVGEEMAKIIGVPSKHLRVPREQFLVPIWALWMPSTHINIEIDTHARSQICKVLVREPSVGPKFRLSRLLN